MRDILLVAFLFIAIYYTFKRPIAGVAAWIWIALMAPAKWTFGFSGSFRLNLTIVLFTALSYFVWKEKPKFQFTSIHFWVFLFAFWMLISTIFNLRIYSGIAWDKYIEFVKVVALFLFISLAVETKKDLDTLIWAIVLAISAYAAMESVKFILSLGGHRITGKAGIIRDRNDLAVAINMCLPLLLYLRTQTSHKTLNQGLLALLLLNMLAIVGTYSRGGFIGLTIVLMFLWFTSKRKVLYLVVALIATPIAYQFAPTEWKERQATVETASTQDGSFIGRLWAWKIATMIAADNPLTGGGFKATTDRVLWHTYAPLTPDYGPIQTPPIPREMLPKAAHNIYFQVLASAGFAGLFIFLCMLASGLFTALKHATKNVKPDNEWAKSLSTYISVALIGYGITGMNVSLAYFELLYALLAILAFIKSHTSISNSMQRAKQVRLRDG